MKHTLLILFLLLTTLFTKAQDVKIKDENFLKKLIELKVDMSNDGVISQREAKAMKELDLSNGNIADLKGIEEFTNLLILKVNQNQLTELNLSANINLEELECTNNKLVKLDISKCIYLVKVECANNNLTKLDVTANKNLSKLNASFNQFEEINLTSNIHLHTLYINNNKLLELNVSPNIKLKFIYAQKNNLKILDLKNNKVLETLDISEMPSLKLVCVESLPFPKEGVNVNMKDSPHVAISNNCNELIKQSIRNKD